jgi:hypothetical protein
MIKKPDKGHQLTDKELEKLEKKISQVYKDAAEEMQGKVTAYFEAFAKRDEEQKSLVGTIVNGTEYTEEDYQRWRLTQIGRGERYEAMRDKLAERYTKANEVAMAYANDDMAKIYALNHAYTIEDVVGKTGGALSGIDWTLFDEQTVKRLIKEQPDLMPYYPKAKAVARGIDLEYGKKQITKSVTSGILQGNSVNQIAKDLMDNVTDMNRTSAVRAARTAITEAENAGRQAAADQLEEKGVILQKRWVAAHDSRTREAHLEADGQTVGNDEPFVVGGEELMYPGDGSLGASGWNLYNCRCTRVTDVSHVKFKSILPASKQGKIKVS